MASLTAKSFDSPDETRAPDKTKLEVVDLGGAKAARMTLQAYVIEAGHDAWIVGDDEFVGYEFESSTVETYAIPPDA